MFEVVATDAHGNVDATPAGRTFTVTAPGAGGSGDGGGAGGGGSGGGGGGDGASGPTLEQMAAALEGDLATAARPIARTRLAVLRRKRKLALTLRALVPGRFSVSLSGTASKKAGGSAALVIAKGARTVTASGTYKVTVRLTKKGRRALRGARRLRGKLTVRFVDSTGRTVVRTKKVTLKRP